MVKIQTGIFQQMQIHVLVLNFVFISVLIADTLIFYIEIPGFPVITWVPFNLLRPLSLNFIAIYVCFLMVIKKIFYFINQRISHLADVSVERNRLSEYGRRQLMAFEINNRLTYYGRLHSDLSNLISILTEYFALPILFVLMIQFCQAMVNLYLILMDMNTHQRNWPQQLAFFLMVIGWLMIRVVSLFFILHTCDSTCEEANRMVNVLHTLWASRALVGYKKMLRILSHRSVRKRLEIKLYGAIQLNNELGYKMAGMITTYLIVMLQLDEETEDDI
uniref:Gustatory receptor n=1 Tax=Meteorus pulchricornis TaxID=51522 RepID=A0A346TLL8_9HYME|nr:gustatory receptor [Meteorus pulchricornis]